MADLNVGNSETPSSGNLNGTASVVNEPGTPNGEASQSATGQDTFIPQGLDINTLPANVRAYVEKINKDMVRGFTEKTSKLSETTKAEVEKAVQSYRDKADRFDQIATQEEFVKQWNDYVQKVTTSGQTPQAGDPKLAQLEAKFQEMNEKIQLTELSQVTDAFADALDDKGEKLHPEFDQLNSISIGKLKEGNDSEDFSILRACVELAEGNTPQEKLANGYKSAKSVYDSIFEAGKKAGMGRLQTKVMNGTNPPSRSGGDVMSVTDKKPKNAHEALELARRGIRVSANE